MPNKTSALIELYAQVKDKIKLDFDEDLLDIASNYYREDRYPNPNYSLPSQEETKDILDFSEMLFEKVCDILDIKKEELI